MNDLMGSATDVREDLQGQDNSWTARAALGSFAHAGTSKLNARAVEFIAKPGKAAELQERIREDVLEALRKRAGFSGTMVLTSQKETRLVLVISFWSTERAAEENHWEESRVVRHTVYPLIDVCARVHTYSAAIPTAPKMTVQIADLQVC